MGTGKTSGCKTKEINGEDFAVGYVFHAFDVTADLSESVGDFIIDRQINICVDMKFSRALENTVDVITFAEFENILEIDRSRNVAFD